MEGQVSEIRDEPTEEVSVDDVKDGNVSSANFEEIQLSTVGEDGDATLESFCQDSPRKKLIKEGRDVLSRMREECATLQKELEKAAAGENNPSELDDPSSRNTELRDELKGKVRVKPTTYDGTNSWDDYAVQFEMLAEMNGWDEKTQALYLAANLRGAAQAVLGDLDKERRRNYKALVKALSSRFGSDNQKELFRVQLRNRQRKRDETLPELAQAVRRLVRSSYPTASYDLQETLSKDHFIDALCDTEVRWRVFQSRPTNLDEAVRIAVEMEAFKVAERQRETLYSRKMARVVSSEQDEKKEKDKEMDALKDKITVMLSEIGKMTESMKVLTSYMGTDKKQVQQPGSKNDPYRRQNWNQQRRNRQTTECWNCHENGHFARECPKPKRAQFQQTWSEQQSSHQGKGPQPAPWSNSRLGNQALGQEDQQ